MKKLIGGVFIGLAVLLLPVMVQACLVNYAITITGSDGADAVFGGQADVVAGVTYKFVLVDSEQLIGESVLENLAIIINSDPEVGIEFGLRAGSSATTYSILSDVVVFDPIVNPSAYASAGVTLTDRTVPANGASVTGLFANGKVHQARYNGTSVFANLVNGFSIPGSTFTTEEATGDQVINATVSSIESEFKFTLSARDSASGTSTFVVVPEPATVCLMGFAALAFLRKQK